MNHRYEKTEVVFLLECFTSCRAYCSGCNINKDKTDEILFTNENLQTINTRIKEYIQFLSKKYNNKEYYVTLALGPGDFMKLPTQKILEIIDYFDDEFILYLGGNLSLNDETEKIKTLYENRKNKQIIFEVIFNPIAKDEHKDITFNNLKAIRETFGHYDIATNLSRSIYDKMTPRELVEAFYNLDVKRNRKLTAINLTSSPNKVLLTKKEFQTSLKRETDYLVELFNVNKEEKYNMEFEAFFDKFDFIYYDKGEREKYNMSLRDIAIIKYERFFYIDKDMNLSFTSGNLGDYHHISLNNLNPLLNLNLNKVEDMYETIEFNKQITKQVNGMKFDKLCSKCVYLDLCVTLPVHWQRQRYKDIKGEEDENYCYGYKQIALAVEGYSEEMKKLYDEIDVY